MWANSIFLQQFGLTNAQLERNKTKEQLEEEKKISLSIRIKPLNIDNLSTEKLRVKAQELWDCIVKLETEKYDLEERQKRQDYDVSCHLLEAREDKSKNAVDVVTFLLETGLDNQFLQRQWESIGTYLAGITT